MPACLGVEFGGVADHCGDVGGAHTGGVLADIYFYFAEGDEGVENPLDWVAFAGADVVDFARITFGDGEVVGADHVAHVGEVALGVEVADRDYGFLFACFDEGDLAGEGCGYECFGLAGADVVEGSDADCGLLVAEEILEGESVLRDLADSVGIVGAEGGVFVNGDVFGANEAVLLSGARDHYAAVGGVSA